MEGRILKEDKTSMDIEIGSLTIAEVLRTYLNKEGAKLAAWRREHPTKNPVLHIESDNPNVPGPAGSMEDDLVKVELYKKYYENIMKITLLHYENILFPE